MLLLPPSVYNSADELFQSVQKFINSQGYALSVAQLILKNIIDTPPLALQNSQVVITKGRSLDISNKQTNLTRRDLFGF
ncbi:1696_t:CDS:2, partial [Dentiscutata erythropus]